ncbi:helix-turn-helix transcriptional regulator [Pseudohalioglobus sediminis]|uniref:Helix-turn-helix transcriptional regulator n=1 Tax=Pseudohalioglobus sediminis TaxID=2606449 RepID=A0A5B0X5U4_9GAMM|nr:AraC family transcriptional regulator [Pseudohalioglobus sediminis]KAA1193948.1 helix-turn-helix transcriptional regulator [Pseudohalioglobus sediminis]
MDWLTWFANLGAAQGLILALAIATVPYGNRLANRILAAFLLAESLRLISLSYYYSGERLMPGMPIYMLQHLSLTFGPLLYLYVHALVDKGFALKPVYLWHFTPMLVAVFLSFPGLMIGELFGQYDSYSDVPSELKSRISFVTLPVDISLATYSAIALRYIQRHQVSIRSEFSNLENIDLRWLKWLLWLCMISAIVAGLFELLQGLHVLDFGRRVVAAAVASVAIIYYIGLMGLRQPRIFDLDSQTATVSEPGEESGAAPGPEKEGGKYLKSGLRDEEVERLWEKLTALMEEDKPYLEPGLKIGDLARRVGSRADYLSQVINTKSRMNFYEFINKFRVDEACLLLEADLNRRHNIADIAQDAGFSSINVFNRHFKRLRNTTPSAYRKNLSA